MINGMIDGKVINLDGNWYWPQPHWDVTGTMFTKGDHVLNALFQFFQVSELLKLSHSLKF